MVGVAPDPPEAQIDGIRNIVIVDILLGNVGGLDDGESFQFFGTKVGAAKGPLPGEGFNYFVGYPGEDEDSGDHGSRGNELGDRAEPSDCIDGRWKVLVFDDEKFGLLSVNNGFDLMEPFTACAVEQAPAK
jgi:hypothetical protein